MNNTLRTASAALALVMAQQTFAEGLLEEILVTAQKREQSVQDVPIAITALSGEFIESRNILSVSDLEKFTPGLRIAQQDASKTFLRIRGVGSRKFDVGASGSVGVFQDEVYLPRFSGADFGLIDLDRVEVLKGPQGTLFGRNTAAGAISAWSRKPTEEFEAYLEAGVGNEDSYLTRGAVSGAVTDELLMRASFGYQQDGGFQENTLTGNTDDRSNAIGRLQARFDASDTLTVSGSVQFSNRQQDALLQKSLALGTEDGSLQPLLLSPLVQAFDNGDFRDYPISDDGEVDYDTWISTLRVEKEFEAFQFVSNTGYLDGEGNIDQDFDANEVDVGASFFDEDYDTFSQEFRLVGESLLLGVYYMLDDAYANYDFAFYGDSLIGLLAGEDVVDAGVTDIETEAWAVFGEYRFDLTEALSVTLGGRYSDDEIDFRLSSTTSAPGIPPTVADYAYDDKKDWDSFDPKVSVTYNLSDDVMLFASYQEGYKAGGIQFTASNELLARQIFDPEELSAYEVGIKSDWLDNTLRLNASAFYYDYEDLQVQRVDLSLSGGLPVAFTSNAAESTVSGFEMDLNWVPVEGLDIRFAYSYLDSEYDDFIGPSGEDFSGNPLPVSPEHTLIASLDYSFELPRGWMMSVGTDWNWVDDYNFDVTDDDEFTKGGDDTLGAARAALVSPGQAWELSAFVTNLTDEEYYSQRTRRSSEVIASAADGRRYGVRIRYNFL